MTLMDRYTQPDLETRDTSNARERLTAAASQCECPDFCPVQHDNDN